jgi:hypothetical protein
MVPSRSAETSIARPQGLKPIRKKRLYRSAEKRCATQSRSTDRLFPQAFSLGINELGFFGAVKVLCLNLHTYETADRDPSPL